ncbi:Glyceraldehyde-3-phosphate dehydrogenase, putative [Pseudomonas sp. CMR5c]|nr:Glyceraldehyde-3-phosphate dehydrogenase, putative [Pseudomonas sp. CMR5c]
MTGLAHQTVFNAAMATQVVFQRPDKPRNDELPVIRARAISNTG